ncbi:MAG: septum formation family protein [Propionicimonas sp.]
MNRAIGALTACVLLLAGCAEAGGRSSAGQVTAPTTVDAYSIRVGDCVGKLETDSTTRLSLMPCDQGHSWEAFATRTLAGDDYPGANAVQAQAVAACTEAFEPFAGVAAKDSKFELRVLTPTKDSWAQLDRTVTCLIGSSAGGLTGSLAGVAR